MCTRTHITTKTITIMEDAYNMLNRLKKKDESFSDVIREFARNRRGSVEAVLECAGLLGVFIKKGKDKQKFSERTKS